ncbi:DsrE family protein [Paenibacillus alvei]|uniref:DsrE family protein n=1 Tax=Paenibacillus alvei TaxID=44250 RepID=A0ABT4GRZ1_PAEAL|nr:MULTISPECIES: DsrE family protein [Paenibacillus]EJW18524.1 SirA family protein [Paenibacillus alvei DSM 29]MBG9735159.1 transcriptional regulator [Paenibacillus alvei]MBG9743617.1 transcriptional regulator [Paenibacillus alvei]MCY9539689.1 DsrE family protein [Paenibacillus alvei]MCY9580021.1 DsrE family protein [Paenibacillus alvei]
MKGKVILLTSDTIGAAENGLGATILETFLTLVKQQEELPVAVFCMNRGVLALTSQSLASLQLAEIEKLGVPVLACKTCVDHYGIADTLTTGEISGMGTFVELAAKHEVLTIG